MLFNMLFRICHWETIFRLCYFKIMVTTRYRKRLLLWNTKGLLLHDFHVGYLNMATLPVIYEDYIPQCWVWPRFFPFLLAITELKQWQQWSLQLKVKKTTTTTLHMHHTFSYTSLPSLHDYDVKVPNFLFCAGKNKRATTFFFFPELRYSTPEKCYFWWMNPRRQK